MCALRKLMLSAGLFCISSVLRQTDDLHLLGAGHFSVMDIFAHFLTLTSHITLEQCDSQSGYNSNILFNLGHKLGPGSNLIYMN